MQLNDVLDDLYKEEGEVYKGTERVNAVKVCAEIDDIPEGYKEVPFYFLSKRNCCCGVLPELSLLETVTAMRT